MRFEFKFHGQTSYLFKNRYCHSLKRGEILHPPDLKFTSSRIKTYNACPMLIFPL